MHMSIIHTPALDIELPPLMDDAFELPKVDESKDILIDPKIVDEKIKRYMRLQNTTLAVDDEITMIVPDTDDTLQISSSELRDIVLTQIVKYADTNGDNVTTERTVDTGMMLCADLLRQYSMYSELPECGFQELLQFMLSRSWVPNSTSKLLAEYVSKFLYSEDNIKWQSVKDVFNFVLDDNTLVLVYIVTYCYTLSVCSPENSFFKGYPGMYLNDLNKFVTNGIALTNDLFKTNKDWHGVIVRGSGQTLLNGMAFSEWFVIAILGLQTGHVGYKLGEKVWMLVHSIVNKCTSSGSDKKINKKQLKNMIEKETERLFQ